jgi:hypothetical protein
LLFSFHSLLHIGEDLYNHFSFLFFFFLCWD